MLMTSHSILVVDDDPEISDLVCQYLGKQGYALRTASTGGEALREIKKVLPSLVLLDVDMPGLNGLSVLRAIRENTLTAALPVILATALGTEHVIRNAGEAGVDDFIVKPYRLADLGLRIGAQLLFPSLSDVVALASQVEPPQRVIKKKASLPEVDPIKWDTYQTHHEGCELCLCTPKDVVPQALVEREELNGSSFLIFAKCASTWRRVWPRAGAK